MIKLIIFDLDGVLVDARQMHYDALNGALAKFSEKFIISKEEHLSTYDGLSTRKKLQLLTALKGVPESLHTAIWHAKQEETHRIIKEEMKFDSRMSHVLSSLKLRNFKIAVASNSIRESVKMMLLNKGLLEYVDFFYSNQDVRHPKPNCEIFLKCMIKANTSPRETLIVEDSHIGRKAAYNSGAFVCPVTCPDDVTIQKINHHIELIPDSNYSPKWQGGRLNVLIPMAGAGSRFQQAGYTFPKPLIEVDGKPMIQTVVENLNIQARHIYVVQKEHFEKYNLKYLLNLITPDCKIVQVDGVTEGAACTTLLAKEYIDNNDPLLFANSDQYLEWNSNEFMYSMVADDIDGGILTFNATHPKWSFVKLNDKGFVSEVAEKKPISNLATCGIYYWRNGSDYVKYAEQMISNNIRVNNEFYVCPVFNEAIKDGKLIKTFPVKNMWGIGTPEDLNHFQNSRKKV